MWYCSLLSVIHFEIVSFHLKMVLGSIFLRCFHNFDSFFFVRFFLSFFSFVGGKSSKDLVFSQLNK